MCTYIMKCHKQEDLNKKEGEESQRNELKGSGKGQRMHIHSEMSQIGGFKQERRDEDRESQRNELKGSGKGQRMHTLKFFWWDP